MDPAERNVAASQLADADVLLHVLQPVNEALLNAAPHLKLIQKIGVGVNTIDLVEAGRRDIFVANMPGSNSAAVAEMSLALLFSAMRNIVLLSEATSQGRANDLPEADTEAATEVLGKTVGLIGFGSIPRRLAPVLDALGATVIHTARSRHQHDVSEPVSMNELLRRSDIISLHIPATAETTGMIDADFLARAKPGVILVNTARGELIDEHALYESLVSGHVRCAALDVIRDEPARPDNPLLQLPNVIVTPHIAWLTRETMDRSIEIAYENCRRLRDGSEPLHSVKT